MLKKVLIFVFCLTLAGFLLPSISAAVTKGEKAPSFTLPDINGKQISLDDFKEKNVLLYLWDFSEEIFMKYLPQIEQVYQEYKGKDVVILCISSNTLTKTKEVIASQKLTFPVLIDESKKVDKVYNSEKAYPVRVIVNKSGVVTDYALGGDALNTTVLDTLIFGVPLAEIGTSATDDPVRLTNEAGDELQPDQSHDGEYIVMRSNMNGITNNIWRMDSRGDNFVRLTDMPSYRRALNPAFHPDGKYVYYMDNSPSGANSHWFCRTLTDGTGGREQNLLIPGGEGGGRLSFSPDGSQFAYRHDGYDENGVRLARRHDIKICNSDGSNLRSIFRNDDMEGDVAWSGDGTRIYFSMTSDGVTSLYSIGIDGTGLNRLTDTSLGDCSQSAVSPDGKKIVFQNKKDPESDYELYIMSSDGSDITRLTNNDFNDVSPTWSYDGCMIIYSSNADGDYDLYAIMEHAPALEKTTKPAVATIEGYGYDYNDDSIGCWNSQYPHLSFDDEKDRIGLPNAVWDGSYYFKDNMLYLIVDNLHSPYSPSHTLGVGYTVTLENATFEDGSVVKNIILCKFSGTPHQTKTIKSIKIIPLKSEIGPKEYYIPGTACPFFADVKLASINGDAYKDNRPIEVPLSKGIKEITLKIKGRVGNCPGCYRSGITTPRTEYEQYGISLITAPINSLIGVFLGDNPPVSSRTPGRLRNEGSSPDTIPQLQHAFFIYHFETSESDVATVKVPEGATRLFLGTLDTYGWYDNVDRYSVEVRELPR
ncbi:MAG: redoxin domain-containing protein [bacterium]|nr:redoxin domain-containing protein [bacterium]